MPFATLVISFVSVSRIKLSLFIDVITPEAASYCKLLASSRSAFLNATYSSLTSALSTFALSPTFPAFKYFVMSSPLVMTFAVNGEVRVAPPIDADTM